MKIAVDVSPLGTGHKVRGVGFYLEHLKNALVRYIPQNSYVFFQRGEKLADDIQIVHFPYFEPFFLALPLYKKFNTVVTVHDLTPIVFPKAFPRGIKGELKWQMQRLALKKANIVITDSQSSKKDIVKYVGVKSSKVQVVYLAAGEQFAKLEAGSWQSEIKKKYDLPDRFLLYVGDVTWNKNIPRLIEAVKKLQIPLVMVGKSLVSEDYDKNNPWNIDLNKINEMAKNNPSIIRLGFIEMDELVQIYNLATLLVMPSLYEGFGLPILEAMACGCPVITSKEGSIPEVAGDAAFYVDAYDVESIENGIRKVFNSRKLQEELVEKGFRNVKKFSWEKTARETNTVYETILSK